MTGRGVAFSLTPVTVYRMNHIFPDLGTSMNFHVRSRLLFLGNLAEIRSPPGHEISEMTLMRNRHSAYLTDRFRVSHSLGR